MNIDEVAQLVNLMQQSSLSLMEVEQNGLRVHLECDRSVEQKQNGEVKVSAAPIIVENMPVEITAINEVIEIPKGDKAITSPMVGTFHVLQNGKAKVGSKLKKGDPVCVIEAMKVMNEILMDEEGELSYMAVKEGEMVEYGQTLFLYI